jgi:glucose/arabinose dehydrogenase
MPRGSRRSTAPRGTLVLGSAAAVLALTLAGAASPGPAKTYTVQVVARDFSFQLSRRSVPAGSMVRFVVRNRGATVHDFVVKGRQTRVLRPGKRQAITVRFPRKGTFRFLCSVSGHARLGMKGTFGVATRPAPPPPPPPPVDRSDAAVLARVGTFEQPVLVTAPAGDERLFVVEQTGAVRIVRGGEILPRPFLDLRGQVTARGEAGLLSIAFAPDYAQSGLLYAFYNARSGPYGDIRVSELRRSTDPDAADPSSERVLLAIEKPYENHNGGMLQVGPDGYLYVSVGDGDPGAVHPPGFYAQRRDDLLGNVLRIDPRTGDPYAVPPDNPFLGEDGVRPEVWAYGLRNPWRFWIDAETGWTFIGDVGSTSREEVNLVPRGGSGLNFGWPCFEGTLVFDEKATCDRPVSPLLERPTADRGCALIGGVVVRDPRLPDLIGSYLYGDLCSGSITAIATDGRRVTASDDLGLTVPLLTSFGVDGSGRVYVTSAVGGVYRLDPRA